MDLKTLTSASLTKVTKMITMTTSQQVRKERTKHPPKRIRHRIGSSSSRIPLLSSQEYKIEVKQEPKGSHSLLLRISFQLIKLTDRFSNL